MNIIEFLYKDIKIYSIFLAISASLEFIFEVIFPISYLPLSIPNKLFLEYAGTAGLYMEYVAMSIVAIALSYKIRSLLPLGIILFISPAFTFIPAYSSSFLWMSLQVAIIIIGIVALFESLFKNGVLSLLLLPTLIMILLSLYAGYMINFEHATLTLSFTYIFLVSLIGFAIYTITWGKIISKRSIVSYIASIPAAFIFLPLYFIVSSNRFMEIIMDMTIPAIFGIIFNNPFHVALFILLLSFASFLIVAIAAKGNTYAGLGYFIIMSTVFLGLTGFHLIMYMISPIIGFALLNLKENNGIRILGARKKSVEKSVQR